MRSDLRLLLGPALLLALGCGDYSNVDLEFLNSLPTREDINPNLPEPSGAQKPAGQTLGTLQSALAPATPTLGLTSRFYEDTKNVADFFQAIANFFVDDLVGGIQRIPPTKRTPTLRQWGPFSPDGHRDFEMQVVIEKTTGNHYDYHFDLRRKTADDSDPWVQFIWGWFDSQGDAHQGQGFLQFENRVLVVAGINTDPSMQSLDWVKLDYDTLAVPRTMRMEFSWLLTTATFEHAEFPDGRGRMHFTVDDASRTLDITSRWLHTGAGRADASISDFFGALGTAAQCWDPQFLLTYHQSSFEDPRLLGSETACPADLP